MRPYFLNIDKSERNNILDLHKTPYDGYATKQTTPNQQPLMVQDFANDKGGITVKSNGEVSQYNNKIYMRESSGECNECGETNEIELGKLSKGGKYKFKRGGYEDDFEFEDEVRYPHGDNMYSFKGIKDSGHLIGKSDIEKYLNEPELGEGESKVCSECGLYEEICECSGGRMYESYDEEFFTDVEDTDNFISLGLHDEPNLTTYGIDSDDEISEPFIEDADEDYDGDEFGDDITFYMVDCEDQPTFERDEDFEKEKINTQVDKSLDMFKRIQKY